MLTASLKFLTALALMDSVFASYSIEQAFIRNELRTVTRREVGVCRVYRDMNGGDRSILDVCRSQNEIESLRFDALGCDGESTSLGFVNTGVNRVGELMTAYTVYCETGDVVDGTRRRLKKAEEETDVGNGNKGGNGKNNDEEKGNSNGNNGKGEEKSEENGSNKEEQPPSAQVNTDYISLVYYDAADCDGVMEDAHCINTVFASNGFCFIDTTDYWRGTCGGGVYLGEVWSRESLARGAGCVGEPAQSASVDMQPRMCYVRGTEVYMQLLGTDENLGEYVILEYTCLSDENKKPEPAQSELEDLLELGVFYDERGTYVFQ
jgi:hypothetical protein